MFNYKSWSSVGIFIAIIVVVNLIFYNLGGRFDYTRNEVYTMSDVTKDVLDNLTDPVTIKIFYSQKFPKELINVKQYVFDLLEEYKAYAGSMLEYEFEEIGDGGHEEKEHAQQYGVMPVQANISENDQFKVQQIFLGIAFILGDKKDAIPFVQKIEQLEYDFTGAIKRLSSGSKSKIGYFTGHDESSFATQNPYAQLSNPNKKEDKVKTAKAKLENLYDLKEVNLSQINKVPDDIKTAIMVNPKEKLSEKARYLIDQYLVNGGKLAVYVDQQRVDIENQIVPIIERQHGLSDFLKNYGIELKNNLVVDENSLMVNVPQRLGQLVVQVQKEYPFFIKVNYFNNKHLTVNRLTEVSLFYASSMDSVANSGYKYTPLLYTSNKSGVAFKNPQTNMYDIKPSQQFIFNRKRMHLAAVTEGNFKSNFTAKPDTVDYQGTHVSVGKSQGKLLVVGDATFMQDDYLAQGNDELFLNTVDWLADENGLISIRSKKVENKPLDNDITKPEAAGTRSFIKILNVLLAPFLLIVFGVVRWIIRMKAKKLAIN